MADQDAGALSQLRDRFVTEQLAPWREERFERARLEAEYDRLNQFTSICLFRLSGSDVTIVEKDPSCIVPPAFASRGACYFGHLADVGRAFPVDGTLIIAVDVQDEATDHRDIPVFSFQKKVGHRNPLLPDADLIELSYLERVEPDRLPYNDKEILATFAGSTTGGGRITRDAVLGAGFPRLRAARYFAGRPEVDFRITSLVQCEPAAERLLREEGFGSAPLGWDFAYRGRFAVSLDGNGAACARPAIILKSRCALIRYESDQRLYYSSGLRHGENCLVVADDGEVVDIVRAERADPGLHQPIALAGTRFADQILSRAFSLSYTAALIAAFGTLVV